MRNQCSSNLSLVERVERLEKEIVVENELNESEEFNSTTEVLRYFRNNRDLKWILNQGGYVLPHTRSGKNKNITIEFVKPYDINKYRGGKSAPDYVSFIINGRLGKLKRDTGFVATTDTEYYEKWKEIRDNFKGSAYTTKNRELTFSYFDSPNATFSSVTIPRLLKKYENTPMMVKDYEDAFARIVAWIKKNE